MNNNEEKATSTKIVKNTVWMYTGFAFNTLIALLITPYIIRNLGVDAYGVFAIVSVVIGYISLIEFGIGTSLIKFIAEYNVKKDYRQINKIISTAFVLYFVLGAMGCGFILVFTDFFANSLFYIPANLTDITKFVFMITAITFFYSFVFGVFSNIIMGLQRFDIKNKIQIIMRVISSAASILVLWLGYGLSEFVIVTALFGVIGITINIIIAKRLMPEISLIPKYFDIRLIKIIASFSFAIFISNMIGIIMFNIDKLLIGIFLPIEQVTIYTIGATLSLMVYSISSQIAPSILPAASELDAKNNKNAIKELILRGTKFAVMLSTPLVIILFTLAHPIVKFWMGSDFEMSVYILQILALGFFVNTFTHALTPTLVGTGNVKIYAYYAIIYIIMNISLSLIFLLKLGVLGAALGTSITLIIVSSTFTIHIFKRFDISVLHLFQTLKKIISVGIVLFILFYLFVNYFPPANLFWLLIYIFCIGGIYLLLVSKCVLDSQEKKLIFKNFIFWSESK
jgi:O-antigen/teichoic acid export membrane protein